MSISNTLIIIPILLLYTVPAISKKKIWSLNISLPKFTQELYIILGVKFKISLSCIITSHSVHMDCYWFPCPHDFLALMSLRTLCLIPFHSSLEICLGCCFEVFSTLPGSTKYSSSEVYHVILVISMGLFPSLKTTRYLSHTSLNLVSGSSLININWTESWHDPYTPVLQHRCSPLNKRHWGTWKKPAATSKMGLALTENGSYAVMCDPQYLRDRLDSLIYCPYKSLRWQL